MRSVVLTAALAVGLWLAAPLAAAAQDPEPTPPPQAKTRDVAVPRGERIRARDAEPARTQGSSDGGRRRAVTTRSETSAASPASAAASDDDGGQRRGAVRRPPSGASSPRGDGGGSVTRGSGSGDSRVRDDNDEWQTRDRAVPRGSVPSPPRQRVYVYPDYYWNYNRYYDPWGYGGFGLGYFYYSPWGWNPYYSSPQYAYGYGGTYAAYGYDVGSVKLKVKPRDAEVYVDNYFAGYVDDFDGIFQSLKVETGGHRIEIRKPGFETLQFDVHVQPERSVTFRGDMRPQP